MIVARQSLVDLGDVGSPAGTGRKHARVKYTVEDYGPEWFKAHGPCAICINLHQPLSICHWTSPDHCQREEQVEERLGFKLDAVRAQGLRFFFGQPCHLEAKPYTFQHRGDFHGWKQTSDGTWSCGLLIPIGRVKDSLGTYAL